MLERLSMLAKGMARDIRIICEKPPAGFALLGVGGCWPTKLKVCGLSKGYYGSNLKNVASKMTKLVRILDLLGLIGLLNC